MRYYMLVKYFGLLGLAIALLVHGLQGDEADRPLLIGAAGGLAAIWAVVFFAMV